LNDPDHILISLEPRHAENILKGYKTVELRRREMKISPGAIVWIYAKLPVGSIIGRTMVTAVHVLAPASLWRRFGASAGVTRSEFFEYFEGVPRGVALELAHCQRLRSAITLESLRRCSKQFQPPQFFTRLGVGHPLLAAISSC